MSLKIDFSPSTHPKTTTAPKAYSDGVCQLTVTGVQLRNSLTATSEQVRLNEASEARAKAISASGMNSADSGRSSPRSCARAP